MGQQAPPAVVAEDQKKPLLPPPQRQQHDTMATRHSGNSLQTGLVASVAHHGSRKRRLGGCLLAAPILACCIFGGVAGVGGVTVPEAPARVDLDVLSGEEVLVEFSAPLSDGGSAVQSYEVGCCCHFLSRLVMKIGQKASRKELHTRISTSEL